MKLSLSVLILLFFSVFSHTQVSALAPYCSAFLARSEALPYMEKSSVFHSFTRLLAAHGFSHQPVLTSQLNFKPDITNVGEGYQPRVALTSASLERIAFHIAQARWAENISSIHIVQEHAAGRNFYAIQIFGGRSGRTGFMIGEMNALKAKLSQEGFLTRVVIGEKRLSNANWFSSEGGNATLQGFSNLLKFREIVPKQEQAFGEVKAELTGLRPGTITSSHPTGIIFTNLTLEKLVSILRTELSFELRSTLRLHFVFVQGEIIAFQLVRIRDTTFEMDVMGEITTSIVRQKTGRERVQFQGLERREGAFSAALQEFVSRGF